MEESKLIDARNMPGLNITPQQFRDLEEKAKAYDAENGDKDIVAYAYPLIIPSNWLRLEAHSYGARYESRNGLRVIMAAQRYEGKPWLHVSLSRSRSLPSHADLCEVKKVFIGKDRTAYQVFPDEAHYININSVVLHLWCCLDGPVTPDFTRGLGGI